MAADVPVMQGARTSAAMVLTRFAQNIVETQKQKG